MSLTSRFSALLMAILGLTLVGFSTALVVSSRIYLNGQVDERLSLILTLLNSSADTKRGWVRWDAREKRLPPNRVNERHATTWLVFDGDGHVLTQPASLRDDDHPRSWLAAGGLADLPDRVTDDHGRSWRVARRTITADSGQMPLPVRPTDTSEGKSYHEKITLVAFASTEENEAALRTLEWFLAGTSSVVLGLAALSSRWFSRQTLVPLTRLVESARSLDASNPGWTLADVGTRDELDDLRRVFNDLLTRLREAYDRQKRFTSEASHQLRTPVAAMIGHLEVAQRHERSGDEYRRIITATHKRAVEFGQVVESLLFLSRADSSTLTRLEALDLGHFLRAHEKARPSDGRSADITVHLPNGGGPLWIKGQPQLLAQLVGNLLDNACKYSRPGTPIVVSTEHADGWVALSVKDSGRGIAGEDLPRVFEPFFRSSPSPDERVPGVGLGLSVVRRIAEAFGGTVAVESEPGRGSRFVARFPRAEAPDLDSDPGD